jgi:hypothetical protein
MRKTRTALYRGKKGRLPGNYGRKYQGKTGEIAPTFGVPLRLSLLDFNDLFCGSSLESATEFSL